MTSSSIQRLLDDLLGSDLSMDEQGLIRFQMELEFVQLLANPSYLNYLAHFQYFEDPQFIKFLRYLQYWRRPEYAKFILYPHCLHFLERLQDAKFRDSLKDNRFTDFLSKQQGLLWQYYRRNRENKAVEAELAQQQQQAQAQSEQAPQQQQNQMVS